MSSIDSLHTAIWDNDLPSVERHLIPLFAVSDYFGAEKTIFRLIVEYDGLLSKELSSRLYEEWLKGFAVPAQKVNALVLASLTVVVNDYDATIFSRLLQAGAPPILAIRFNADFLNNEDFILHETMIDNRLKPLSYLLDEHFPTPAPNIEPFLSNPHLSHHIIKGKPLFHLHKLMQEWQKNDAIYLAEEGKPKHAASAHIDRAVEKRHFLEALKLHMENLTLPAVLSELASEEGQLGLAPVEITIELINAILSELPDLLPAEDELLNNYSGQLQKLKARLEHDLALEDWLAVRTHNRTRSALRAEIEKANRSHVAANVSVLASPRIRRNNLKLLEKGL